jgi:hypothetical protein
MALRALPRPWRPLLFFLPHARLRLTYAQHLHVEAFVNQELLQIQLLNTSFFCESSVLGESYWFKLQNTLFTQFKIHTVSHSIMVYSVRIKIGMGANKIESLCCQEATA